FKLCFKLIFKYPAKFDKTKGSPTICYASSVVNSFNSKFNLSNLSKDIVLFGNILGGQNVHFKLQIFVISICTFLNLLITY
ncbi:hypothetical protein ACOTVX_11525, partial [Aliarcobacter butzleri]